MACARRRVASRPARRHTTGPVGRAQARPGRPPPDGDPDVRGWPGRAGGGRPGRQHAPDGAALQLPGARHSVFGRGMRDGGAEQRHARLGPPRRAHLAVLARHIGRGRWPRGPARRRPRPVVRLSRPGHGHLPGDPRVAGWFHRPDQHHRDGRAAQQLEPGPRLPGRPGDQRAGRTVAGHQPGCWRGRRLRRAGVRRPWRASWRRQPAGSSWVQFTVVLDGPPMAPVGCDFDGSPCTFSSPGAP